MEKITFIALHLGYGGIESAITNLANQLVNDYEVEIVSTYELYDKPAFYIDPRVTVKYLYRGLKPNRQEFIDSLYEFRLINAFKEGLKSLKTLYLKKHLMVKYIKNCDSDIIISCRDIHNKWVGKYAKENVLKIGWEDNHHHGDEKYVQNVIDSISNLDYTVFVSEELTDFYMAKQDKCKCIFIPNMLDYIPEKKSSLNSNNIISIGRFSKEKGFVDLIDVFSEVHKKYPDWKLNLVGDGTEYQSVVSRIAEHDINGSVILHGFQDKEYINNLLLNSSIYVMTSYTESFGLVLIEAMNFGIPCIAFDSAEGANDIIDHGKNGYLIKDRSKQAMANKIISLIESKTIRKRLGKEAINTSKKYYPDEITKKWLKLFGK
jgi:N-acetylglucosaminyldiphosphoundecaprenol N-acetyl-beta-D-mannosaminyltransferase